jgi:hypothetical protein
MKDEKILILHTRNKETLAKHMLTGGQLYTKPNLASQETEQEKKLRSPCSLAVTQES